MQKPLLSHKPLLVILGPTASGKSSLAMAVARRVGAWILSADSMQVYRGMDIGTAKPTPAEQHEIPHHGINLVEPTEEFTVARFVQLADATVGAAAKAQVPLIITGGTPLYYKSMLEGLFEGPGADVAIRDRLRSLSSEQLVRRLAEVDPLAAARIHANDSKRLIRALEVYELTGRPISTFQTHWTKPVARHSALRIGLSWDREVLNHRINVRTRDMLSSGWMEEVRQLMRCYPTLSKTAGEATGYRELIDHLHGRQTLEEAGEQIKIATRQLARRQMKWFRRFPDVHWLDGSRSLETLIAEVIGLWSGKGAG